MHRRHALALLAAAPWPARAHEPSARQAGLLPAGEALLRVWGLAIYRARLWVGRGFEAGAPARHPLLLELAYLRDFRGADIARRSLEEMARLEPIDEALRQRWQDALAALVPDVRAGDRLSGWQQPGEGARFLGPDGRELGRIDEPRFARLFFGIWLDPRSREPALRRALLGPFAPPV